MRLALNALGRDFVVGDIHGCFSMLDSCLEKVGFDPVADRVISVGDLVDRGPESERVLEYLGQPWFHSCRGNHEALILASKGAGDNRHMALLMRDGMGAGWFLSLPTDRQQAIRAAFDALPFAIEIERPGELVGVVHAEVSVWMDWPRFTAALTANDKSVALDALEGRSRIKAGYREPVTGVDRLYVGHTIQSGRPRKIGNVHYIDTGAFFKYRPGGCGKLTLIQL